MIASSLAALAYTTVAGGRDAGPVPLALLNSLHDARFVTGLLFVQSLASILVVLASATGIDRRDPAELGLEGIGRGSRRVGEGLGLGLAMASVVVLFAAGVGRRPPILYGFAGSGWFWAPAAAVGVGVAAFAEEWFFRGYLFVNLREKGSAATAILATAAVFALFHASNPGSGPVPFANILAVGIVIAQLRELTGSLAVPFGFHLGWNLAVGMLFGAEVSGLTLPSLLRTSLGGLPVFLGGGAFGPEGSLAVTVLFAATALYLGRRLARRPSAWKGDDPG